MMKEVICAATEKSQEIYQPLKNFEFWKVIRIATWIWQILENCKRKKKWSGLVETKKKYFLYLKYRSYNQTINIQKNKIINQKNKHLK